MNWEKGRSKKDASLTEVLHDVNFTEPIESDLFARRVKLTKKEGRGV